MTKKKALEVGLVIVAAVVLIGSGFWLGWASGRQYPENIVVHDVAGIAPGASSSASVADFGVFWQAWQDINDLYLRNPSTTPEKKVQGAISGMVSSLGDPYTEFFSPVANQQFQQDITGHFGGI